MTSLDLTVAVVIVVVVVISGVISHFRAPPRPSEFLSLCGLW
jgi:hypothetical protein